MLRARTPLAVFLLLATAFGACAVRTGAPLPSFEVAAIDGRVVSDAALRGRPAIVALWSPGCFACVAELSGLQAIQDELGPDRLSVVGLYSMGGPADVHTIATGQGLRFPLAKVEPSLLRRLGGLTVPAALVVDSQGRIVERLRGPQAKAVYLRWVAAAIAPVQGAPPR